MAFRDLIPWRGGQGVAPGRFEPFGLINDLQREMNHLFETLPRGWTGLTTGEYDRGYVPDVDVEETDTAVKVEAELPGMTEQDVEVSIAPDGGALILKGEKKLDRERTDKGVYRHERSWGVFQRTVALPAAVDPNEVEATFKHGVLMVNMHKAKEATKATKKIPITKAD